MVTVMLRTFADTNCHIKMVLVNRSSVSLSFKSSVCLLFVEFFVLFVDQLNGEVLLIAVWIVV